MIRHVAIEGIDGSGKDVQAKLLADAWAAEGECVLTREPHDDSEIGAYLRKLLSSGQGMEAHALLFAADRVMYQPRLAEWLRNGSRIVQVRSLLSTMVYQRAMWSASTLFRMHETLYVLPDAFVVLTVPVDVSAHRIQRRESAPEVYERSALLHDAAKRYGEYVAVGTLCGRPVVGINGVGTPEQVHKRVTEALMEF